MMIFLTDLHALLIFSGDHPVLTLIREAVVYIKLCECAIDVIEEVFRDVVCGALYL